MRTEPQGLVLPSNPGRISIARRIPRGVIGIISPFNFPLILSMRAVGPSLATGNAVVLKPDPRTVMTGGFIVARVFEEAGLPKGVLHGSGPRGHVPRPVETCHGAAPFENGTALQTEADRPGV